MINLIAVALDGSAPSLKAMELAVCLARQHGALLHIVSGLQPADPSSSSSEALAANQTVLQCLAEQQAVARSLADREGVQTVTNILPGSITDAMVDCATIHNIDMMVIGEEVHSSIFGALLATTAEKLVRVAPCSVLVVR